MRDVATIDHAERGGAKPRPLADFNADGRLLMLAFMAVIVGSAGAFAALGLVKLIALVTNLAWFGRLDTASGMPWPRIFSEP